jgi:hypothetical protein
VNPHPSTQGVALGCYVPAFQAERRLPPSHAEDGDPII